MKKVVLAISTILLLSSNIALSKDTSTVSKNTCEHLFELSTFTLAEAERDGFIQYGSPRHEDYNVVSRIGVNPNATRIEQKFLANFAKDSFRKIMQNPKSSKALIDMFVKLGFISKSYKDPFYPELILASENKNMDLTQKHSDPEVQKYLQAKGFLKYAEKNKLPTTLLRRSDDEQFDFLYWQFLKILDQIPDEAHDSIDTVAAAFIEINRFSENGITTPEQMSENVDKIFGNITSEATYIEQKSHLPWYFKYAAELGGEIVPFASMIMELTTLGYNKIFKRDSELHKTYVKPDAKKHGYKIMNGTFKLFYLKKDIYGYGLKSKEFLAKVFQNQINLVNPESIDALKQVYPELKYFKDDNNPVTQRILYFLKLISSQNNPLRYVVVSDLKLANANGELDSEKVDQFITYLLSDAVGSGSSPFLDRLEKVYHYRAMSNNSIQKSIYLMRRYLLVSYSFERQSFSTEETFLRALEAQQELSPLEALKIGTDINSKNKVASLSPEQKRLIFYFELMSYLGSFNEGNVKIKIDRLQEMRAAL